MSPNSRIPLVEKYPELGVLTTLLDYGSSDLEKRVLALSREAELVKAKADIALLLADVRVQKGD